VTRAAERVRVDATSEQQRGSALGCLLVAARIGLTCFGGPVPLLG
jgi:hypothetical protein